jgi:toxin YoeB
MKLIFSEQAWHDYLHWQAHDPKLVARINGLIKECVRTPFKGTGKPEPLRGALSGWWSRRINQEHRLVYRPSEDGLLIAQCRYHYG